MKTKTIHKPKLVDNFTITSNAMVRDKRLSFRARGILVMMLSMPQDWQTHASWIEDQGTEGREAVRAALNELEALGYLKRQVVKNGDKFAGKVWEWNWEPSDGFPSDGYPTVGKPASKKNRQYKGDPSCSAVENGKRKEKGGFVPKRTRFYVKPLPQYPQTEDELVELLETHGLDYNPDYDGGFWEEFSTRNWKLPNGDPVADVAKLYESRLEKCVPQPF